MMVDYVGLMLPSAAIVVVIGVIAAVLTAVTKKRESRA